MGWGGVGNGNVLLEDVLYLSIILVTFQHICEVWQNMLGLGPEDWVPTQDYEEALAFCKRMKEVLTEATDEEQAEIMAHWPWDDMDEGKYM